MLSKLTALREKKGLSVAEMADRLDIPVDCWVDIEEGRRLLTTETLEEVAGILDTVPQNLLEDEEQRLSRLAGHRLRELRETRGLSLNELAKRCGVSAAHLSELERAASGGSLKIWELLAEELGVNLTFFFQEVQEESLGQKMRRLRTTRKLTQKQLADQVGISYSLVAQIESDKVKPAISTLTKLARQLGVSPCYFLTDDPASGPGTKLEEEVNRRPLLRQLVKTLSALEDGELAVFQELADQFLEAKAKLGLNQAGSGCGNQSQAAE